MDHRREGTGLERELTQALQRPPAVDVPEDFAARCAEAALVQLGKVAPMRAHLSVGRSMAVVSAVWLLLFLVWLAPYTRTGDPLALAVMYAACAYLIALALWLGSGLRTAN